MAGLDLEYIELYVSNEQTAVDYLVSLFGFTQVAEVRDGESRSLLLAQGSVQPIVTAGPAAAAFLDEHGDGVADIAFSCDDLAGTLDAAVAAGATVVRREPGRPVVSGFGATCHTLTPRSATVRLPGDRSWTLASAAPAGHIRLLDHIAICVAAGTLADWSDFYTDGFGLGRYSSEYTAVGDQGMDSVVVRSLSGGITFTLLEPDSAKKPGQLDAFLSRNAGPGTQHLAFGVDSIISAVHEFRDQGVRFLHTPAAYYDLLAERLPDIRPEIADLRAVGVLADHDEWGYLLQLFTSSPYERNTFFYELIQRQGARGFGSANIKALYEAVERDRLAAA